MKNNRKFFFLFLIVFFAILLVPSKALMAAGFNTKASVSKLKKSSVKENSVKLTWKKYKEASGYHVYRATSKKGSYKKIKAIKKTSFTDKNLKAGTTYYYKVCAYKKLKKGRLWSKYSKVVVVRTKGSSKQDTETAVTTEKKTETATVDTTEKKTETATVDTTEKKTEDATETTTEKKTEETTTATTEATTEETIEDSFEMIQQNLDYSESKARLNNPDQGFYVPLTVTVTPAAVIYNKNIVNNSTRLYHLRIDISAFAEANNENGDIPLTGAALSGLDELLAFLREKDKNAVVRFAYAPGFGNKENAEPALDYIVNHIKQLAPILNRYPDTITAVEFGLIGPWGEMHSSVMAGDTEAVNTLIDTYLDNVIDLPILVRTPGRIYNYLGLTREEALKTTIAAEDKAYRLGMYNDGYLGSDTDLGTYGGTTRQAEIAWIANQTSHMPYGGEVVIPDSNLHDIDKCLPEMYAEHLSYLNVQWNDEVIAKWKKNHYTSDAGEDTLYYGETAFAYIENHMGYRFVLTDSKLGYRRDTFDLKGELAIKNVGFGNLNKVKQMTLLFVDSNESVITKNIGGYSGETKITFDALVGLSEGEYQVYLRLDNGDGKYAVRFANDLWDENLSANKIGIIKIER